MNDMQKRILGLLMEVDELCRKYDIEYYLEGGAILGALRHGGFLPWDDDSDLAMTRSNWEKFQEAFFKENPENRALEAPELNDMYPTNTVRYIDTTTTNIFRSLMLDVCACGLAVDIFILEDAPDDDDLLEKMKEDFIDYCEIINPFYRLSSLGDGKRYQHYLEKSRQLGQKAVTDELNEKINQYYGQPSKRYLMRWGMRFQVYNKDVFGKPVYVPFEDTMLPIPAKPVDYLIYQYGIDWLMIPRENEVEVHDTIRDMDRGYKEYMADYMPLIDKEQALDECLQYKISEMEILDYNKAYHRHIYGTAANAAAQLLHKKLERMQVDLSTAFAQVTPQTEKLFDELFTDYLNKQLHQWYVFYQVFVPVEDDVIGCVVSYLLRTGRCRQAEKLVNIRTLQKKPCSPLLEKAIRSYQLLAESSCLFWTGKHAEAVSLIRSAKDVDLAPTEIAFCQYEALKSCPAEGLAAFRAEVEQHLRLYPQEDLFKLIYVMVLLRGSDHAHAAFILKDLLDNSCHGMVLQMIRADAACQELLTSTAQA